MDDSETHGSDERKKPGRPRKEKRAEPKSRTARIEVEMYEQMSGYLEWQRRTTGKSLQRSELLWNAWLAFCQFPEPPDLSLITGKRRRALMAMLEYFSRAPANDHDAKAMDSVLTVAEHILRKRKTRLKRK